MRIYVGVPPRVWRKEQERGRESERKVEGAVVVEVVVVVVVD